MRSLTLLRYFTKTGLAVVFFALPACGGANATPAVSPSAEPPVTSPPPPPRAEPEPEKAEVAATAPSPAPTTPKPAEEAAAEPCDSGWICLRVSFETKAVGKRQTKLLGDPKVPETWSKNTDGRPVTFDTFSKGAVELFLRRKPGDKNEVVAKLENNEIILDRRDGTIDDFTHVGLMAAEQNGELLVDLKYLKAN
jgi:hypothetical protein